MSAQWEWLAGWDMLHDPMASIGIFLFGLLAALLVVNALRRPTPPDHRLPPMWLAGVITSEASGLWVVVTPVVAASFVAAGANRSDLGKLGLGLCVLAWIGQLEVWRRSRKAVRSIGSPVDLPGGRLARVVSWSGGLPDEVVRVEHDLAPHPHRPEPLQMDLYRPRAGATPRPLIVWMHAGGWRGGSRRRGGLTLLRHLARAGWTVAAVDYPLSPAATFPDHLIAVDAASDFAEKSPDIDGGVVLVGASAGAHLAAVGALTRPGVRGFVGLYGIYDFRNRYGIRPDWPLIPRVVMKATAEEDPEAYHLASPLDLVHPSAPPSLLVVPEFDSLVPAAESYRFAEALESVGAQVTVLRVPWAQHGFDNLAGPRTRAVAAVVEGWLTATLQPAPSAGGRQDDEEA